MKIYKVKVNGKTYKVELEAIEEVKSAAKEESAAPVKEEPKKAAAGPVDASLNQVLSPIQGQVVNILVKPGDNVKKGDPVVIIEAMKLENEVVSTFNGEIVSVLVSKGQNVAAKDVLVTVK